MARAIRVRIFPLPPKMFHEACCGRKRPLWRPPASPPKAGAVWPAETSMPDGGRIADSRDREGPRYLRFDQSLLNSHPISRPGSIEPRCSPGHGSPPLSRALAASRCDMVIRISLEAGRPKYPRRKPKRAAWIEKDCAGPFASMGMTSTQVPPSLRQANDGQHRTRLHLVPGTDCDY